MTNDLINRLSKLDAPDREVDAQIYILFNIPAERAGRIDYSNGMVGWWPKDGPYVSAVTVPAFTASVDAVIALAARELPGANVLMGWGQTKDTKPWARIGVTPSHDATGFNLATALCIALLRAKEASNGQ